MDIHTATKTSPALSVSSSKTAGLVDEIKSDLEASEKGPDPIQGVAYFSTVGGQFAARPAGWPRPPTIVRSNFHRDVQQSIEDLRKKFPFICNAIFLGHDIRWYFDECDWHVQGGKFLWTVLDEMRKQNEASLSEVAKDWIDANIDNTAFRTKGQILDATLETLFSLQARRKWGSPFLERLRHYMIPEFEVASARVLSPNGRVCDESHQVSNRMSPTVSGGEGLQTMFERGDHLSDRISTSPKGQSSKESDTMTAVHAQETEHLEDGIPKLSVVGQAHVNTQDESGVSSLHKFDPLTHNFEPADSVDPKVATSAPETSTPIEQARLGNGELGSAATNPPSVGAEMQNVPYQVQQATTFAQARSLPSFGHEFEPFRGQIPFPVQHVDLQQAFEYRPDLSQPIFTYMLPGSNGPLLVDPRFPAFVPFGDILPGHATSDPQFWSGRSVGVSPQTFQLPQGESRRAAPRPSNTGKKCLNRAGKHSNSNNSDDSRRVSFSGTSDGYPVRRTSHGNAQFHQYPRPDHGRMQTSGEDFKPWQCERRPAELFSRNNAAHALTSNPQRTDGRYSGNDTDHFNRQGMLSESLGMAPRGNGYRAPLLVDSNSFERHSDSYLSYRHQLLLRDGPHAVTAEHIGDLVTHVLSLFMPRTHGMSKEDITMVLLQIVRVKEVKITVPPTGGARAMIDLFSSSDARVLLRSGPVNCGDGIHLRFLVPKAYLDNARSDYQKSASRFSKHHKYSVESRSPEADARYPSLPRRNSVVSSPDDRRPLPHSAASKDTARPDDIKAIITTYSPQDARSGVDRRRCSMESGSKLTPLESIVENTEPLLPKTLSRSQSQSSSDPDINTNVPLAENMIDSTSAPTGIGASPDASDGLPLSVRSELHDKPKGTAVPLLLTRDAHSDVPASTLRPASTSFELESPRDLSTKHQQLSEEASALRNTMDSPLPKHDVPALVTPPGSPSVDVRPSHAVVVETESFEVNSQKTCNVIVDAPADSATEATRSNMVARAPTSDVLVPPTSDFGKSNDVTLQSPRVVRREEVDAATTVEAESTVVRLAQDAEEPAAMLPQATGKNEDNKQMMAMTHADTETSTNISWETEDQDNTNEAEVEHNSSTGVAGNEEKIVQDVGEMSFSDLFSFTKRGRSSSPRTSITTPEGFHMWRKDYELLLTATMKVPFSEKQKMQHEKDGITLKHRFKDLEKSVREGDAKANSGSKSFNKKWSKKRGKLVEQYRSLTDELALLRGRVERSVPKSASPDRRRISHGHPVVKPVPEEVILTRPSITELGQDSGGKMGYKFTQGNLTDGVLDSRERGSADDGRMLLFDSLKTAAEPGDKPTMQTS